MDDPFVDREAQIQCFLEERPGTLICVYGEAGIGKTRLLRETARRIRRNDKDVRVAWIDLESYSGSSNQCSHHFLSDVASSFEMSDQIKAQLDTSAPPDAGYLEEMAGKVLLQLAGSHERDSWIFVDTTEVLQSVTSFWRWIEEYLVGPLLSDERYHLVFSGRVPAPWQHADVRRSLRRLALEALDTETHSIELAKERIHHQNQSIDPVELAAAARLVVKYSSGHPDLTCKLSDFVGEKWGSIHEPDLELQMCEAVVKPFIDRSFLRDVGQDLGEDWLKILWAACILNWFTTNILRKLLDFALPDLAQHYSDKPFFYIEAINKLRLQYSVIWRDKQGEDHLHGVIGNIMRSYLKTSDYPRYQALLEAAAQTFQAITEEFPAGDPDAARYQQEADYFVNLMGKEPVQ